MTFSSQCVGASQRYMTAIHTAVVLQKDLIVVFVMTAIHLTKCHRRSAVALFCEI